MVDDDVVMMGSEMTNIYLTRATIIIIITTGICKLCEQLDIDALEDVRVLVLLWKLGANKKPAEIQKEEWMAGCHKLQLDSVDKFKKTLPSLDTGFLDREEFGDFYKVS